MDLLSVVVPVYNSEKYIERCVESILAQTYSNLEIILVDDGSSDLSGRICDGYAKKNKNIIAIHQSNEGITKARLEGARRSKGKYITFVDSDDWIEECFYERMLEDEENYDLIISGIYRFYDEKACRKELSLCSGIYYKDRILNEVIPCMMWDFHKNMWALDPSLCTKIFKRQLLINELEKIIEVGSYYGEDSMALYPMMFHIEKMKAVNEAFYYHRQRAKGKFPYYIEDELFLEKLHFVYMYLKNEFRKAGYLDVMNSQLEFFYFKSVKLKERSYGFPWCWPFPIFPFCDVEKESRVILYGAGEFGVKYMEQNEKYGFCNIICWVDRNYKKMKNSAREILDPKVMKEKEFDYVIIAIDNYHIAMEIKSYLLELCVPEKKIIWHGTRRCTEEQE